MKSFRKVEAAIAEIDKRVVSLQHEIKLNQKEIEDLKGQIKRLEEKKESKLKEILGILVPFLTAVTLAPSAFTTLVHILTWLKNYLQF